MSAPVTLRTALKRYPHTAPLLDGTLAAPGLVLDVQDISPIHKAFAPMVRAEAFDLCELAVVTALQAVAYGRPVVLLPVVVASRFQRGCMITRRVDGVMSPAELSGKRVGVRSYTQTTGMWVRAHLKEDAGVAADAVRWFTSDPPHVEQYTDPGWVTRVDKARPLVDMLREGDVDAVILGNDLPDDDEFAAVTHDAVERDYVWWQQHGFVPVNHMVVAGASAAAAHPDAIRAAYALLRAGDAQVQREAGAPVPTLFGFQKLRAPLELIIDTCLDQGLLPRRLSVDELLAPAMTILGSSGD